LSLSQLTTAFSGKEWRSVESADMSKSVVTLE
jgi:hypothetical protein